jgi:hypothetical protein
VTRTGAELLPRFAVYGRFYSASFGGATSHLEVFDPTLGSPDVSRADADLDLHAQSNKRIGSAVRHIRVIHLSDSRTLKAPAAAFSGRILE